MGSVWHLLRIDEKRAGIRIAGALCGVTSTAIAVRSAATRAGLRTAITFDAADGTTSVDARGGTEEQRRALAEAVVRIAADHTPRPLGSLLCGTRLEHISTLACYNERMFHLVVRYSPMLSEAPAHHMPSFARATSAQAAQAAQAARDGNHVGYHLEPGDLNFPALARREAQAVAVLAVLSDLMSSPPLAGDSRLLPLTITESAGSHVWVSYTERGLVHGASIDTLMRRAYEAAGAAGIGSAFVVDTVPADHKNDLAAVTAVRVGFNTEGLTREKRHALAAALAPLAKQIIRADSVFIWASSSGESGESGESGDGGTEHHAQMAAVTVRPNAPVTIRITDPHGLGGAPGLGDVPVIPTGTVFGRLFLQLGAAFGVSVSPALQGQEPTCMIWSTVMLLAHVLEPSTRAQSMWLTSLVSVLYRRSICVDKPPDIQDAESHSRPSSARPSLKRKLGAESTSASSTSASSSSRSRVTTSTTTTTTRESTRTCQSATSETTEHTVIVISDSDSEAENPEK